VIFPWAVPAASLLPEALKAMIETLRSTGGAFESMKTIQAQRNTAPNETDTTTGLRVIFTVVPTSS
jgi:hypothetical protein